MLRVEKIDSLDGVAGLREEWKQLLGACSDSTPFLTLEWLRNWWRSFGEGKDLCVLLVREGGRPRVIAPLMLYTGWWYRRGLKLPVRVLESISNHHSNRTDFVYSRWEPEHWAALWDYLVHQEDWHLLRLYPVYQNAPSLQMLRAFAQERGLQALFTHCQTSPYLPVDRDWSEYSQTLPAEIRRRARKAERSGFHWQLVTGEPGLREAMEQVFEVSGKGWAGRQGTGLGSSERLRRFYSGLAQTAAEQGWLFLCLLKRGAETVAYEFNLHYQQRLYNLKVAFDERFAHHGPGNVLKYFLLSELFQGRWSVREYDFLGDAAPYKLVWTRRRRLHVKLVLYHPGRIYSQLLCRLQAVAERHPLLRKKRVRFSPPLRVGNPGHGERIEVERR